jgi:hypothetical protein
MTVHAENAESCRGVAMQRLIGSESSGELSARS